MPTYTEVKTVAVTTDSSGDVTAYTPSITGRVISIRYVKGDFTNGVDFTITSENTGQTIWTDTDINASETVAPRQPIHDTAGVALVYNSDNDPITDHIYLANDRVKIVIASGGSATTGTFHVTIG